MGLFDKIFKKERKYEQPYPDEQHKALVELQKIIPDKKLSKLTPSLAKIKSMEQQLPTHWIYKYVNDPRQFVCRNQSLRSSMVGEYDKTLLICKEGLTQYPNDPYLLYMLGRTLYDIGRVTRDQNKIKEAADVLDHLLTLHRDFSDAYYERGKCKLFFGQLNEAEKDISSAVKFETEELSIKEWKETLEQIRILKNKKYQGRGIKVFYFISPHIKDDSVLKEIGQMEIITQNFYPVYINGHNKKEKGMWVKLFCPNAKFSLINQKEDIEKIYSNIYDHIIDDAKAIFNTYGYKMLGYSFEIVYQIFPEESPDIIPMFKLETLKDKKVDTE